MMKAYEEVKDLAFPGKPEKGKPWVSNQRHDWKVREATRLIEKPKELHLWKTLDTDAVKRVKGLIDQEIPKWTESARRYVSGIGDRSGSVCVGLMSRGDTGDRPYLYAVEPSKSDGGFAELAGWLNRILTNWAAKHAPDWFGWTTLQINYNTVAD